MTFRTELIIPRGPFLLNPTERTLLLGSCFAQEMGSRMRASFWPAVVNPLGVLFNPESIANAVAIALAGEGAHLHEAANSVFAHGSSWVSWLCDSSVSAQSRDVCIRRVIEALKNLEDALRVSSAIVITLGTAFVYRLESGRVVANCHKQPARLFRRERLSVGQVAAHLDSILDRIDNHNPTAKVIFTVSPVRHIGDGLPENMLSKSTLRLAVDEVCRRWESAVYFPAYELLCDDLRDYRFYARDMVHPSDAAADYIWEKFQETFLSEDSRRIVDKGRKLRTRLNHRPLFPDSPEAETFARKSRELLEQHLCNIGVDSAFFM
ncbi:MAG: GSCFA domain-containing protein [Muribaculaceae bacterium]|nr:GSCFA domain-containing protein [Muribaculaceae bacterium]